MKKILTISIAAYNVESYIKQNLDSLMDEDLIDKLEIFVIDDGGKDGSFEIAKQYETLYPDSIHAIHKENGGYGSTVNYSLAHATGKYFKLLDGDDWLKKDGLKRMIYDLEKLDVDIYLSPYIKFVDHHIVDQESFKGVDLNKCLRISKLPHNIMFGMLSMTYKTDVLRKSNIKLPEHMLYTDQYFATIPLAYADSIYFTDNPIYCYRLGLDGQSVSMQSRINHIETTLKICKDLVEFCKTLDENKNINYEYITYRVAGVCCRGIRTLLLKPINKENLEAIKRFDNFIKITSKDVYRKQTVMGNTGKMVYWLRNTNFVLYWAFRIIPKKKLNWH